MAIASKFTRGAVAGNGWTNPGNATADDGVYATCLPAKNGSVSGDWDFASFSTAEIPDGSVITKVEVEVQYKSDTTGSAGATLTQQLFDITVAQGTATSSGMALADTVALQSVSPGSFSLADLQNSGRVVARVIGLRGNSNTAITWSIDYIKLNVTFFAAISVPSVVESDRGALWDDLFPGADVSGSWGTPGDRPYGGSYTLGGTTWSVASHKGVFSSTGSTGTAQLSGLSKYPSDVEWRVKLNLSTTPGSPSPEIRLRTGLSSTNQLYPIFAVDSTGAVSVTFERVNGGTSTGFGPSATLITGLGLAEDFWVAFRLTGRSPVNLQAKAWKASAAEPAWQTVLAYNDPDGVVQTWGALSYLVLGFIPWSGTQTYNVSEVQLLTSELLAHGAALVQPIVIKPTAIPSAEAFSTANVGPVKPTAIPTAEVVGSPVLLPVNTISPTAIASQEAFGIPIVGRSISPTAIASAEAFGNTNVGPVKPTAIPTAEAVGSPTLTISSSSRTIVPTAIDGSGGAPAFVQFLGSIAFGPTVGTSSVLTVASKTVTAGDTIIVGAGIYDGTKSNQTCVDNLGNVYTPVAYGGFPASSSAIIFAAPVTNPGVLTSITISHDTATYSAVSAAEFSGVGALDAAQTALGNSNGSGTTATWMPSGTIAANGLAIGFVYINGAFGIVAGPASGSPSTTIVLDDYRPDGSNISTGYAHAIAGTSAVTGFVGTVTYGTSDTWKSVGATFLPVAAAALGRPVVKPSSIIAPTAIASGEGFGSSTLVPGSVVIAPTAIASQEGFGAFALKPSSTISPTGIPSSEAFGAPAVVAGSVSIQPSSVSSAEAVGAPTLVQQSLALTISPTGIVSGEAFGSHRLVATANILPTGITTGETSGSHQLIATANILPTSIPTGEVFGTTVLLAGPVVISPTGIPTAEAVGVPLLAASATISPTGIVSGEVVGTPTLLTGGVLVAPSSVPTAEAFGAPSLKASAVILPTAIGPGEVVGTPTVVAVATIIPSGVPTAEFVGTPTLVSAAGARFIQPTGVPTAEAVGNPTLVATANILVTGVPSAEAVGNPTLVSTATILPVGIPSQEVFGIATLVATTQILPVAIPTAEVVGTPVLAATAVIAPPTIASGEVVGTPVLTATATILPVGIPSQEAVGNAIVSVGPAFISPVGIPSAETLGTPVLAAVAKILPTAIPTGEALGTTTVVAGNVNIQPGGIPTGEGVGIPAIAGATSAIRPIAIVSAEAVGTPLLRLSTLSVVAIPSAEALGTPVLVATVSILPTGIASGEAIGAHVLKPVNAISVTGIPSAEVLGTLIVRAGNVNVQPTGIPTGEASGSQSVLPGAVVIGPTGVVSQEALGTPTIVKGTAAIVPNGVPSGEVLGVPSLQTAGAVIFVNGIPTTEVVGLPTLLAIASIVPETIASAEALGLPKLLTIQFIRPGSILSAEVVGIPGFAQLLAGWQWVNPTPAFASTKQRGFPELQDEEAHTKERGFPELQDSFAHSKRNEGSK